MSKKDHVTEILKAMERDGSCASDQLLPLVYNELRRLAAQKMARESPDHTLQPTALVHEAYVRLMGTAPGQSWENRNHFYAAAAEAMRRILIEDARRKQSLKHGGGRLRREFNEDVASCEADDPTDLLALDEALTKFAAFDPETARLVEMRFFAGLSVEEAAQSLGISARTAKRNWSYARAWLRREMDRG